ncbi:hypothetical protein [Ktedonobacter racemifer]|nr:hypothetical protein [Ktedonobacter racemifer]
MAPISLDLFSVLVTLTAHNPDVSDCRITLADCKTWPLPPLIASLMS